MKNKKKNQNCVSFTVRLNLNKPLHRETWQKLQDSPLSYPATVVEAMTKKEAQPASLPDAAMLKSIVYQAVSEAMREMPAAARPVIPVVESSGSAEISDEDLAAAEDFMSILCGED